jgi:tryptophan synthase alpha chain
MSSLKQTFDILRQQRRKGLIVYLTAGFPDCETTIAAAWAAAAAGADIIEIGLPFSDPMADGPVIQRAATEAINKGITSAAALNAISRIRQRSQTPLAVMTYFNTVLQYGIDNFTGDFAKAGVSGLIIPDLPVEESMAVEPACSRSGLDLIQFVAPPSTEDRISTICAHANGFIYCVSTTGVTGVRRTDYSGIGNVIEKIRSYTDIPTAVGFGIGSPAAACDAARYCDAVIIGSAVIERLQSDGVQAVAGFIADVRRALDEEG